MAKNTLELINEVGKNLRRSNGTTYTSLTQDQNAVSILQAINEAKREVEEAWKWDALRTTITFSSTAGTHVYDTSDAAVATVAQTNDRSSIARDEGGRLQFWDVTNVEEEYRLGERSIEYSEHLDTLEATSFEKPYLVSVYQNGSGLIVHFPFAPSGVRNYKMVAFVPQDDLAATDTVVKVPWRPIVLRATELALADRGDDERREAKFARQYQDALGKAIGHQSDEWDMTMVPV